MELKMEVIEPVNGIIETAKNALTFFDLVYSKIDSIKIKQLSAENYLRAYYFEVINNLELLNTINFAKLKTLPVNSVSFRKIINRLETQIGATLLFTDAIEPTSRLYAFLKSKGRIQNKNRGLIHYQKGIEIPFKGKILYENVLQAISFTVVKIEVLKQLASFDEEELAMIHTLMLEKRLINIRERFQMIKTILDEMEGIRELSR